jgi:signal transduction histidine kinase
MSDETQALLVERRQTQEARRQRAIVTGINRVFRQAITCRTSEEIGETCLDVAEGITGSKFGFIGEVNQRGRFDTIALSDPGWSACRIEETAAVRMIRDMEIRGIWGRVLKDERATIVNDPAIHSDRVGVPEGHPPIKSFLGVPLKHGGKTIGMIGLANKPSGYDAADRGAVEALSVAFVEALLRRRAEEALQRAHDELEHRVEERTAELAHEQRMLRQLLHSHDRERLLIAYEIHDGLAQRLVAAQMQLQAAEQLAGQEPEKGAELYQAGMTLLAEGIAETRQLISGLRPPVLDESGVVAAVDDLVRNTRAEEEMEIEFVTCLKPHRLEPLLENAIFRIVQESLTNARRHSRSDRLRIELVEQDDLIRIEVRDWGIGFDPERIATSRFGLRGIQERARLLGGRVAIESTAGEGTRVAVELPLAVARDDGASQADWVL